MKLYSYTDRRGWRRLFINLNNVLDYATEDVTAVLGYKHTTHHHKQIGDYVYVYFETEYGVETSAEAIIHIVETED